MCCFKCKMYFSAARKDDYAEHIVWCGCPKKRTYVGGSVSGPPKIWHCWRCKFNIPHIRSSKGDGCSRDRYNRNRNARDDGHRSSSKARYERLRILNLILLIINSVLMIRLYVFFSQQMNDGSRMTSIYKKNTTVKRKSNNSCTNGLFHNYLNTMDDDSN